MDDDKFCYVCVWCGGVDPFSGEECSLWHEDDDEEELVQ